MDQVKTALVFTGYNLLNSSNQSNFGAAFITLKDWKEREVPGKRFVLYCQGTYGKRHGPFQKDRYSYSIRRQ